MFMQENCRRSCNLCGVRKATTCHASIASPRLAGRRKNKNGTTKAHNPFHKS